MKKLITVLLGSAFILIACNDNKNTASESGSQDTAQKSGDNVTATQTDTSSKSMMTSMMNHMDQMKNMKSMNDPDHDFAMMMKHHHLAANEMAEAELLHGHHTEVKSLARKMLNEQTKDIQEFDNFLNSTPAENKPGNDKFHKETMQMMNDMPMNMNQTSSDVDEQFISMMIPHHEQAVHMTNMYLKYAKKPEIKTLANKILKAQEKEIKDLKDLQAKSH